MIPDSVINSANVCQVATTFISLSAYFPQWIKLYQTRSSEDISLRSWCLWVVSSSFTVFYAIVQFLLNHRGLPLIISSSVTFGSVLFTVWLIVRFRKR